MRRSEGQAKSCVTVRSPVARRARPVAGYFAFIAAVAFAVGYGALALTKLASGPAVLGLMSASVDATPAAHSSDQVLGSGDALSDLVSGTYERKSSKKSANLPAKAKIIDVSRRSGLLKTAPVRTLSEPFGFFFGVAGTVEPELLPVLPPVLRSRSAKPVGEGYRTMCVRLCDGAYFPVSTSTSVDNFERDEAKCKSSCTSPAELYVYRNDGGALETMEDLEGRPYARLTTAFQFRAAYDASCTCKPHPWEEAARAAHRQYASQAQSKKPGDRRAGLPAQSPGIAAEFLAQTPRPALQSVPRLAAATTDVMTDASLLPSVSTTDIPMFIETIPSPRVTTEPVEMPSQEDIEVEPLKAKADRQTRRRTLSGRSSLGRAPDGGSLLQAGTGRRRSTASDDFMLNFRR